MDKRALLAGFFLTFLLGICLLRTSYLATDEEGTREVAIGQSSQTLTVATVRGTLYDRNLTPLVNATTEYRAAVLPLAGTATNLKAYLSAESAADLAMRLIGGTPITIRLEQLIPPITGVATFEVPVRYAETVLAPHVIGYVDSSGMTGVTGMEYAVNDLLNDCAGQAAVTYEVNALGQVIEGGTIVVSNTLAAASGGVALTLDADLQRIAEKAAAGMTRGAIVFMEPYTGEILAMVSCPSYQPTALEEALEASGSPLLNRAVTDYNCGSVFKIVTTAAALEAGISAATTFTCSGSIEVDGTLFYCHDRAGHGELTMEQAFALSCNVYYMSLAQEVGAARLYDMAVNLGFSRMAVLCENWSTARALLPELSVLQQSAAELANLSIGQGRLMATPVHIAAMTAAIVNGGRTVSPTLLLGEVGQDGTVTPAASTAATREVFSEETAAIIREMMALTMSDGTGVRAQPTRLAAAGKTGTAETGWIENGQEVVQSWVTGYYPAEDPQVVVTVLVENSEASGESAAPVFKEICEEYDEYRLA